MRTTSRARREGQGNPAGRRLLVITDLDGTLLSSQNYDWTPAGPILKELERRSIPLILASSKTRAEMLVWAERLATRAPFLFENGGALQVPEDLGPVPGAVNKDGAWLVEFGTPYSVIRAGLRTLAERSGVALRGFGDMAPEEIRRLTGLEGDDLGRAGRREYDEPFLADRRLRAEEEARLFEEAARLGLRVTRGGRFYHLTGEHDKSVALDCLRGLYSPNGENVLALALGDSGNDLELLRAADRAFVVAHPDGSHSTELRAGLPGAYFTREPGPAGFSEAIREYLEAPW